MNLFVTWGNAVATTMNALVTVTVDAMDVATEQKLVLSMACVPLSPYHLLTSMKKLHCNNNLVVPVAPLHLPLHAMRNGALDILALITNGANEAVG